MKRVKKIITKAMFVLLCNPALFFKILNAKIKSVRPLPKLPFQKRINGILFDFDIDYDPLIKLMYYGAYEVATVEVMEKTLKKGDTFVDVGANIGYLSAIAMGLVGKTGQVHSFEPVPQYFHRLRNIATANKEYKIVVNQCALGDEQGTARIAVTSLPSTGWNTMVPGLMSSETIKEIFEVPVYRLDSYIKEKALNDISLIKIDTEGFEFPILRGLSDYFENTPYRPAIICEICPDVYSLLGCSLAQLSEYMKKYNYRSFSRFDTDAEVDITELEETTNIVFISK